MTQEIKKKIKYFGIYYFILGYLLGFLSWATLNQGDLTVVFLQNQFSRQVIFYLLGSFGLLGIVLLWGKSTYQDLVELKVKKKLGLLIAVLMTALFWPLWESHGGENSFFSFLRFFQEAHWTWQLPIWAWSWGLIFYWNGFLKDIKIKKPANLATLMAVSFFVLYTSLNFWMQQNVDTKAFDFGIYDQTLWQMACRGSLYNSINNFGHAFGAHFQPILLFLSLFYRLWDDARMLIILEVAIVTLGAIPVFRMAQRRFNHSLFSLALVFAYLFFVGNRGALGFPTHPSTFMAPLLLFAFDFFEQRKWLWHGIFMVLGLLVKENASNYVVVFGMYIIFFERKYWKLGLIYVFGGISWLWLVSKVIIPGFIDKDYGFFYYKALGNTQLEGLLTLVCNPVYVVKLMLENKVKVATLFSSVSGSGLAVFFSPYFLFMAPGLVEQLTSSRAAMWVNSVYYGAPLAFGFVLATLGGAAVLKKINFLNLGKGLLNVVAVVIILATLGNFKDYKFITLANFDDKKELQEAIKMLSVDDKVSAQNCLVPQVSHRSTVYRYPEVHEAEFILLSTSYSNWPLPEPVFKEKLRNLLKDKNWRLIYSKRNILLFQKFEEGPRKYSEDKSVKLSQDVIKYLQGDSHENRD